MDTLVVRIPAVALRGMVILPGMIAHFDISRDKSVKAVERCMMESQKIFLVTQKNVEQENPGVEDLYRVGVIAEVKQVIKLQNNIIRILVEGQERAELEAFPETEEYLLAELIRFDEQAEELPDEVKAAMIRSIQETYSRYQTVNPRAGKELLRQIAGIKEVDKLMDHTADSISLAF